MKNLLILLLALVQMNSIIAQVKTQIGTSVYDLQSNSSIERRVAVHPTSKDVIVTFTGSNEASTGAFDDRGTGYLFWSTSASEWRNYKNAVVTTPRDSFNSRPETTRVGWPNPMFIGNSEVILSHKSSTGMNGLYQVSRATAGTGTWTQKDITSGTETWPRAAASGNNVVAISSHFEAAFNEVDAGVMFIKSTDGGANWTAPAVIPGIDKDNYVNIGGDRYAIDLYNNTVAVLTGSDDVTLYKSTDMGTNWTKKSLISTAYNFVQDGEILDRENRSDGAFSVLVDNNGKAHCFWARSVTFSDPSQGTGTFIDITRSGIMYWNEDMGTKSPIILPNTEFIREHIAGPLFPSGRFNTAGGTLSYAGSNGGYRMNTTTWPSTGIDAVGTIYLSYAYNRGIIDTTPANTGAGKDGDKNGFNLYDVYVMKSSDNGATWVGPTNVSSTPIMETTYPSMARLVDDHIHMVYQEDSLYGNAVMTAPGAGNGTGSQAGPIYTKNNQIYAKFPVTSIVNPISDITNPTLRFSNKFQNNVLRKNLQQLQAVIFVGCSIDTVSGANFVKNKQFFIDNYIDFSEDTSLLTIIGLDTINTSVPGDRLIRITGRDAAGNLTLSNGSTFFDTMNMGISILADEEAPTITLLGSSPDYAYKGGAAYVDPSVEVKDNNPCTASTFNKSGTVDVSTSGSYEITYTATDAANLTGTAKRTVIVGMEPTAKITEEAITNNVLKGNASTSTNIEASSSPIFSWYLKKGNSQLTTNLGSNANKPVFTYNIIAATPSFDSLCVKVTNGFNAKFTKPDSRTCVYLKYAVGISQVTNSDLNVSVYPNPSNGNINLKVEGNKSNKVNVTITNMEGKTLMNHQMDVKNSIVPIETNLSKGTYFITTEIDNKVNLEKIEVR